MEWLIGLVVLVVLGFVVNKLTEGQESPEVLFAQKINKAIRDLPDFNARHRFSTSNNRSAILYDEEAGKIGFMSVAGDEPRFEVFAQNELVSSEVDVDGETVTKTMRGSQLAGAAVGAIVAGGVGAIIGGLSGKQSQNQKVKSIKLKVVVDRPGSPSRQITFLNTETEKGSPEFQSAAKEAATWQDRIAVLIRRAQSAGANDTPAAPMSASGSNGNVDQLERLWSLKEKGAISDDEYNRQKNQILGAGGTDS